MKILVATASQAVARNLSAILEKAGHECIISPEGAKAINEVYKNPPDLIVLDVAIAKPSIYETIKSLKTAPSTRDIPVLAIAAPRSLKQMAKCYQLGIYDYLSRPFFTEEVLSRIGNIGYVTEKMKEVEKMLVRDYLTGLYNRKFFMERLAEEISWSTRYAEPLSLLILDIDHFKKINDTYGHGCGDEVLRQLAKVLSSSLRAYDVVARYGGEEFVVLLSNTGAEDALTVAEKLRAKIENSDFACEAAENGKLAVTISVGAATTDACAEVPFDALIDAADDALYRAKANGRNQVASARKSPISAQNEVPWNEP